MTRALARAAAWVNELSSSAVGFALSILIYVSDLIRGADTVLKCFDVTWCLIWIVIVRLDLLLKQRGGQ